MTASGTPSKGVLSSESKSHILPLDENEEINWLNYGEDDKMEIYGYERSESKTIFTWVLILCSLGVVRLIFHWYPHWMIYMTHRRCKLKDSSQVIVVESLQEKHKFYNVQKTVKKSLKQLNSGNDEVRFEAHEIEDTPTIRIYLNDGTYIDESEMLLVQVKKLFYIWCEEKCQFMKIAGLDKGLTKSELHNIRGISKYEQHLRRIVYGKNEITINLQSIGKLIALEVLNPFYMFQVFTLAVWFAEMYFYYSCAIVLMSIFGVGSAVWQTRQNQKKLQETIHSVGTVTVCRSTGICKAEETYETISTNLLVPGDVIIIPRHGFILPCDCILLSGNCIVNESMLTGESVPVTKTAVPCHDIQFNERCDMSHILFCGTEVVQARYYADRFVYAVVLRTGFLTAKGSLVRSILFPIPHDFKFDRDTYKFVWFLAGIAFIGVIYSFVIKTINGDDMYSTITDSLDIITIVVPPALPAAMTVGKFYAMRRLEKKYITCINPSVINVAGSINCVCFDKTGTLTEDGLDMHGVITVENKRLCNLVTDTENLGTYDHDLAQAMACCHSLTLINKIPSGDPLDVKMFESTGWILEEPNVTDSIKFDLLAPTIVKSSKTEPTTEIGLIHQFQFSSEFQRMSVITSKLGEPSMTVYCKGSPEMIKSLCIPNTVPSNHTTTLQYYAGQGFRVIAIAYKKTAYIDPYKLRKLHRDKVESDLTYLGLIIFENKLKEKTTPIIAELKQAKMRIIMLTGDNIQTAVCVAKECGIIARTETVVNVSAVALSGLQPKIFYTGSAYDSPLLIQKAATLGTKHDGRKEVELGVKLGVNHRLAMTGQTWQAIRQLYPSLIPKMVATGVIFARMSPDQKQQVVEELQKLGNAVAMCGDGANDCGALRTAHVGVSLSENESSVASPFTSRVADISCVTKIICEGRAALVTSFGLFKFMVLYSLVEFFSTAIMFSINSNLTDFQFLYIDLCVVTTLAFTFGQCRAHHGPLVSKIPLTNLTALIPVVSMISQCVIMFAFQICVFFGIRYFPWYKAIYATKEYQYSNYENYAIFSLSQFQYIILAVIYSYGKPFREPIYKNKYFFACLIITTLASAYIAVFPSDIIRKLFQLNPPNDVDFRFVMMAVAFTNALVSLFAESFLINYVLRKASHKPANNNQNGVSRRNLFYNDKENGFAFKSQRDDNSSESSYYGSIQNRDTF